MSGPGPGPGWDTATRSSPRNVRFGAWPRMGQRLEVSTQRSRMDAESRRDVLAGVAVHLNRKSGTLQTERANQVEQSGPSGVGRTGRRRDGDPRDDESGEGATSDLRVAAEQTERLLGREASERWLESRDGAIARPPPAIGQPAEPGPDGIQVDVPHEFQKVLVMADQLVGEPLVQHMSTDAVRPVVPLAEQPVQPVHAAGEATVPDANDQ